MGAFDQIAASRLNLDSASGLPWLAQQRGIARGDWLAGPLPTRKTEAWKYTGLDPLGERDYLQLAPRVALTAPGLPLIEGLDADRLVFVNGHFDAALSSVAAQDGVTAIPFSAADEQQRALIGAQLGSIATGHGNPFAALNGCWMNDGVLVQVAGGVRANRPLYVVHLLAAGESAFAAAQRLLLILEPQAELQLIEHFVSAAGAADSLMTGTTELRIGAGARLQHFRLQLEDEQALHIGGIYAELQRDARLEGFVIGLGSRLKRLDLRVRHLGPGSEAHLDGVYLAHRSQHIDLHTSVEHESPHGTTRQVYRGIIDDAARAVFNGRIHIHPHAQKTSADLSNRNLLLSNEAEIDTKPELEIYADDVRCSHGATVSRIEEKNLYYLLTRGIGRAEAEVLLGFGFINELFGDVPIEALRAALRDVLRGWFGRSAELTRHLQ
jgi:Fe-S cluster assembly protein SufD